MRVLIAISRVLMAVLLNLCLPCGRATAHPEGFSGLHVTIDGDRIRAAITLHTRDFGAWFPPARYPDYVADVTREMETTVDEIIEVQVDQQPLPVDGARAFLREVGLIEVDVDFTLPSSSDTVELLVWSKHLIHLPRGHQQLLFVEDRRGISNDVEHGLIRLEDVLTVERDAAAVLLPALRQMATVTSGQGVPKIGDSHLDQGSGDTGEHHADRETSSSVRKPKAGAAAERSSSRVSFFRFGVEHILTGYDHLLFLAALLLACKTFKEAAAIITCFTVAHSITLALAALDVVRMPASIVEPAIALTIVYVAVENLLRTPTLWRRAAVTCFFGLIHGLGFASALREIGLDSIPGGIFWPLLKFNLGVEVGQLCVAAFCLPGLLFARKRERWSTILTVVGSALIALIGGYWLVSRVIPLFLFGP